MILRTRRFTFIAAASIIGVVMSACSGGGGGDTSTSDGPVPLVATTGIWADITSEIACGEPVTSIIPSGTDPHTFESSLRDREVLEGAGVIVANGAGLEEGLTDLLETVAASGTTVIEVADVVDLITDESDDSEPADGEHGGADPHIWLDPLRVADALDSIGAAVIAAGRDPDEIDTCTSGYRERLIALDAETTELLGVVPSGDRVLVTNHDSLAYFADRYGFEVLGTVIPSTSTMAETNPAQLAVLADLIADNDVPAIFAEEIESNADATALADRLGVDIRLLVTGSLDDAPPADTYIGMIRANATVIAEALAP